MDKSIKLPEDFYFPRVYLNLAGALADSKLWEQLDKNNNSEFEIQLYTRVSLISGTVVFCYMTIEGFVNYHLKKKLTKEKYEDINRKDLQTKLKYLCLESSIDNIASDFKLWEDFKKLEGLRHIFVHRNNEKLENYLNHNKETSPSKLLNTTLGIINYFYLKTGIEKPKYLIGNLYWFNGIETTH